MRNTGILTSRYFRFFMCSARYILLKSMPENKKPPFPKNGKEAAYRGSTLDLSLYALTRRTWNATYFTLQAHGRTAGLPQRRFQPGDSASLLRQRLLYPPGRSLYIYIISIHQKNRFVNRFEKIFSVLFRRL